MKQILFVVLLAFCVQVIAQEETVKELRIEGLKRTKESFIRRLVKVKPGAVYDSIKAATDMDRLSRLPGFAKGQYTAEQNADGTYTLTYNLVENFTLIPGLNIANDNNNDFSYRLSLFEFNLFGRNQLVGGFYQNDVFESFGFFWEAPYLFTNKFGLGVNYQNNINQEPVFFPEQTLNYKFDSKAFEAYFIYEFNFRNRAELGVFFSDERYTFLPEQSDGALPPDKPAILSADRVTFRGEYEYNNIEVVFQNVSGFRSLLDVRIVTGNTSEEFLNNFFIGRNDFEYFKLVGDKGNWASRLRLAFASDNDNPFAPFTLDNQLNIRGVGNTVDRGTAAIVLNTEYRHTFFEKGWFAFQGNAFIDAGTWRNPGGEISDLFNGTSTKLYPGIGVRFIHKRIFNAVFRLDYGFGIGNDATNGIVFGIGQYF